MARDLVPAAVDAMTRRPARRVVARLVWAGALAAGLALSACADDDVLPAAQPDVEPGFEHVHGFGVNPADDRLYAATHFGLWRADDGHMERVGDAHHDLMGFTVLGADRFAASGHPLGGGADLPPHLGFIVSDDGGETWRSVALMGQADFHTLRLADDKLYGYDASGGRLMISEDGGEWSVRASDVALADLVVDPDDRAHLLASDAEDPMQQQTRLVRSHDGGRGWETVDAPGFVRLSWTRADRLFGVDVAGVLYHSDDAGESWREVSELPTVPGALLDHDGRLYADAGTQVLVSDDDGASWQVYATAS